MSKRVGIPRSLFFYQYYPLWKTFFEELGAEIIVSDATSKKILDAGVKSSIDEACLPVKLFHGHVLNLKDRVDYLFIPRFTSISKNEYVCPKFGGLPDMIRHTLKELPMIIDTEVDLRRSKRNSIKAAMKVGGYFCSDNSLIKNAYKKALDSYRMYRDQVRKENLPSDILGLCEYKAKIDGARHSGDFIMEKRKPVLSKIDSNTLNIAVIGHVYNLYDSFANMNMIQKLRNDGVRVITADMIDTAIINEKCGTLPKKIFWNFGRKAIGSVFHMLERDDIDGIIYLMSFGCGVDSFVCDLIERRVRQTSNIPFIIITIDEHSGEAGLNTRLEAFVDMIRIKSSQKLLWNREAMR